MTRKIIAIDCDGVIRDIHSKIIELYNNAYGENLKKKDITDWDFSKFSKTDIFSFAFGEHLSTIYLNSKPIPDAVSTINKLRKEYFVFVLSHQNSHKKRLFTEMWLEKKFKHLPVKFVDNAEDKDKHIKYDILIDDRPNSIIDCSNVILFRQPWNKDVVHDGLVVGNWKEAYDVIKDFLGE